MDNNSVVIICITGYSGSGKSRASNILENILPNAYCIHCDEYLPDYLIQFSKETERIFREPVMTNDGLSYFSQFEQKLTAEVWKEFYDIFHPFVNVKVVEDINTIVLEHRILFMIVEYMALPSLDIWERADCKLLVRTDNHELQLDLLSKRKDFSCNKKTAENRHFAVKEYIEGVAECVDYTVSNNYDENFDYEIKNIASQIMKIYGVN